MRDWTDPDLHELASQFFRTFARMEYALKAAGYLTTMRGNDAQPDWNRFAKEVQTVIEEPQDPDVADAVAYILKHPPKKQVVVNNKLEWDDTPPQTNFEADRVLIYVRRIRNNLFHGGKFNGRWFEPQRSGALIQYGLTILKACRDYEPQVAKAYSS